MKLGLKQTVEIRRRSYFDRCKKLGADGQRVEKDKSIVITKMDCFISQKRCRDSKTYRVHCKNKVS